jgi:hypothetical protein
MGGGCGYSTVGSLINIYNKIDYIFTVINLKRTNPYEAGLFYILVKKVRISAAEPC